MFTFLQGWRRSKRRRSSSGKRQTWRLLLAWLSWVPLRNRSTCWRRRQMKTSFLNEVLQFTISLILFVMCLSGNVSVSSKWRKVVFVCFCDFVVSVLNDAVWRSCRAEVVPHLVVTLHWINSLLWHNLNKNPCKCVYTWPAIEMKGFHVMEKVVNISVSSQHFEALRAV